MYLNVSYKGFDKDEHFLNFHFQGEHVVSNFKKIKENRAVIQAYLYRIQSRIDRGHMKGAIQLFNRLITMLNLPLWVVSALKFELKRP